MIIGPSKVYREKMLHIEEKYLAPRRLIKYVVVTQIIELALLIYLVWRGCN